MLKFCFIMFIYLYQQFYLNPGYCAGSYNHRPGYDNRAVHTVHYNARLS